MVIYIPLFKANNGSEIWMLMYELAALFSLTNRARTVTIWYNFNGMWVYGCTNTGKYTIKFISLSMLNLTNLML